MLRNGEAVSSNKRPGQPEPAARSVAEADRIQPVDDDILKIYQSAKKRGSGVTFVSESREKIASRIAEERPLTSEDVKDFALGLSPKQEPTAIAIAHFRSEGVHMRGVVSMSEAVFMTSDGKTIPYGDITFDVVPAAKGGLTVCFRAIKDRCDPISLDPQFVVSVMNWVSGGGTSAFTLAQDRSISFLKSIDMQSVSSDNEEYVQVHSTRHLW
jgi:hypothetical protein